MPRFGRTLRLTIVVILMAGQLSCMRTTQVATGEHVAYIKGGPTRIWVTRHDGSRVLVNTPQIVMDTLLTGWAADGATFVGMPVSEVKTISAREPSTRRTIGLFAALAGISVIAILLGGEKPDDQYIEED